VPSQVHDEGLLLLNERRRDTKHRGQAADPDLIDLLVDVAVAGIQLLLASIRGDRVIVNF
jgi:hypothetical protein